ncbi:lysozyme inhibitor LprI family protein [Pseudooceanicola algae]|uniref:Uncharacterized protein n=1 Tax=Pseudooceanicola algae TaxID=1537215 RepID=A0A418SCZ5_9RHOB|nr:hypothetical protein [Pseudooceanicola algae]QPM92347.1 hypothetical protein PSAL_036110 [Pseudooceanicola algae]
MFKILARLIPISLLTCSISASASLAQPQNGWTVSRQDDLGLVTADAHVAGSSILSMRCLRPDSTASLAMTDHVTGPGEINLLLAADAREASVTADQTFALIVDDRRVLNLPMRHDGSSNILHATLLLSAPMFSSLQQGSELQIQSGIRGLGNRVLSLSGSGASIGSLLEFCSSVIGSRQMPQPGFDCAMAQTATEVSLCTDPNLARLDADIASAYASARDSGASDVLDQQREFIRNRRDCNGGFSCIRSLSQDRLDQLTRHPALLAEITRNDVGTAPTAAGALPVSALPPAAMAQDAQDITAAGALSRLRARMMLHLISERDLENERGELVFINDIYGAKTMDWAGLIEVEDTLRNRLLEGGIRAMADLQDKARGLYLPDRITMDIGAVLTPDQGAISVSFDPSGNGAITNLFDDAPVPGLSPSQVVNFAVTLTPGSPHFIRMPLDEIQDFSLPLQTSRDLLEAGLDRPVNATLQVTLELDRPLARKPLGRDGLRAKGTAVVLPSRTLSASLSLRDADIPGVQQQLHQWQFDGADTAITAPGADVDALATALGLGIDTSLGQPRYVLPTFGDDAMIDPDWRARTFAAARMKPDLASAFPGPSYASALELRWRAAAAIRLEPDLPFEIGFAQKVAFGAMTALDRAEILAPDLLPDPNISRSSKHPTAVALQAAEPDLRALIERSTPALPLPMRRYAWITLPEHDPALNGFDLSDSLAAFAQAQLTAEGTAYPGLPDGLRRQVLHMAPEEAAALLDRLETAGNGRRVLAALDHDAFPIRRDAGLGMGNQIGSMGGSQLRLQQRPHLFRALYLKEGYDGAVIEHFTFDPAASDTLPPFVHQTTAATLLGHLPEERLKSRIAPFIDREGRTHLEQTVIVTNEARRLRDLARDIHTIAFTMRMGPYRRERDGYLVSLQLADDPNPNLLDATPYPFPEIEIGDPEGFEILPISPDDLSRLAGFADPTTAEMTVLVEAPVKGVSPEDRVILGWPLQMHFGPRKQFSNRLETIAMSVPVPTPEPPTLILADADEFEVPDRLYMTPELADLLTLRLLPDLLNEASFHRMMAERLTLERDFAARAQTPPWGPFFEDPAKPFDTLALPAFVDWTRARAEALPDRLSFSLSNRHPLTGCLGLIELPPEGFQTAATMNYAALVGDHAASIAPNFGRPLQSEVPMPGQNTALIFTGRPLHTRQTRTSCRWQPEPDVARLQDSDAPFADVVLIVPDLPSLGTLGATAVAADLHADISAFRTIDLGPGPDDQPGLSAAIVLELDVNGADIWQRGNAGQPPVIGASLTPEDWQAGAAQSPSALDILGMSIGMTETDFLTQARTHLGQPGVFRTLPASDPGLYSTAVGLAKPDGSDRLLAILQQTAEGPEVAALMRTALYPIGQVTTGALMDALKQKYGTPSHESLDHGAGRIAFGAPPQDLDPMGVCGRYHLDHSPRHISWEAIDTTGFEVGSSASQPNIWKEFGWPTETTAIPESFANRGLPHCGPMVVAWIRELPTERRLQLTIWSLDLPSALARQENAPDPEPEAVPEIKL